MDNNMIHIDDLVRQRLRGGEEPERPGAWLSMRELLDKEMPVSAGYNWRRIVGYFTALLLLTTASVGGYRLYNSRTAFSGVTVNGGGGGNSAYNGATGGVGNLPVVAANSNDYSKAINPVSSTTSNTPADKNSSTTSSSDPAAHASSHVASNAKRTTPGGNHRSEVSRRSESVNNHAPSGTVATTSTGNQSVSPATSTGTTQPKTIPDSKLVQNQPAARPHVYASASSASARRNNAHAPHTANLSASETHILQPAAGINQSATSLHPTLAIIKHDSVERLEIVVRRMYDAGNNRTYYRIDTFPAGKFARNIMLPTIQDEVASTDIPSKLKKHGLFARKHSTATSTDAPSLALKQSANPAASGSRNSLADADKPIVPGATISARPSEKEAGSSSASLASSASAKHFSLWDAEKQKIDAAINQFKLNIARLQVYPGIMGGINGSFFTPNALGGLQAGLTSLFILNDWWSLMTEFKYIQRFNTGSSVRDNYMEVIDGSGNITPTTYQGQQYLQYNWTDHTIQHSFNYDIVRTFEVPVMLRYNWGRFYAQGGANLVFSSAIAAKEVTHPLDDYTVHSELRPGTTPQSYITNDHPTMQISDFGSHFGVGYVGSFGIMFSPSIYFDARLTQTFWDNSKTGGAKQVSKDLLRTPSIQLSVGYRFVKKH